MKGGGQIMNTLKEPISKVVWDSKYRYRQDSEVLDHTIEDTWQRVAKAIAKAEKRPERQHWERAFYHLLEGFHFLPGGRILAGAGTKHNVTLFNCFVMNIASDSLPGIFSALKEGGLTLQQGGGIGYDFSVLRPSGDRAKKSGAKASGPISFMRIWDTMCQVLVSTGARRGAMMGVLRCDHPDIETFISAKEEANELRHFNVSVMVSDLFMEAVKQDAEWALVFPTEEGGQKELVYRHWGTSSTPVACRVYRYVRARDLWHKMIRSAYDCAEPGVLFLDTINRMNNLWYRERINATNPCGEIPLPPYGACNLGSLNLTQFVRGAFSKEAYLDWSSLEETAHIATRFLDNVIDVSRYPLNVQKQQALGSRRLGLGITGLGDAFVMLGLRYGSPASIALAAEIMQRIASVTWQTSIELAREKGVFPFYTQDYLRGNFVATLSHSLRRELEKYGVRNSHHNTIAPTGTISLLANNVSNGVEPIFLANYDRHVRITPDETTTFRVQDYAYHCWQQAHQTEAMPPAWIDTGLLMPEAHLQMQGAVQPYIDNAISKTINIPPSFPFEKLADVYTKAYELGLKGCTVFRPNPITGSVLEVPEEHCCQYEGV
jgi:ribonucleoside-diphosphate reductase alpha chain